MSGGAPAERPASHGVELARGLNCRRSGPGVTSRLLAREGWRRRRGGFQTCPWAVRASTCCWLPSEIFFLNLWLKDACSIIQAFMELAGVAVLLLEAERIREEAKPAMCAQ